MAFTFTPLYAPLTESEIRAVVRAAFGAQAQLDQARPANGGLFNTSYVIETCHPSQKAILRVAPSNQAILVGFEKAMMALIDPFSPRHPFRLAFGLRRGSWG